MTATHEAAAFRARIQYRRRVSSFPRRTECLNVHGARLKAATLALLARRANRLRDRYESAAYAQACEQQRAHLAYLNRR